MDVILGFIFDLLGEYAVECVFELVTRVLQQFAK
jgi:hypothetical protein